jgi:hypothetical protein
MLKTLFNPKIEDICPNCGKACATTDVLCPNCGKNLDELFEQLPDSVTSSFTPPKWIMFSMKAKASRAWRVLNSIILITAFVAPWELYFSDFTLEYSTVIGWKVLSYSIPSDLPDIFSFGCLPCMGRGLIAFGYLGLVLYAILNFLQGVLDGKSRNHSFLKVLRFCIITSSLFLLRIAQPLIDTALAWGYWLACVGLISSLCLEAVEFISRKSIVEQLVSKAA